MKNHIILDAQQRKKYAARNKYMAKDKAYVDAHNKSGHQISNYSSKISTDRKRLLRAIQNHDASLLKDVNDMSLDNLDKIVKTNDISVKSRRNDWKVFEQDIAKGLNKLFKNGFFKLQYEDGRLKTVTDKDVEADNKGGPVDSDVRVVSKNGKSFFIECKLDYESSEYFKFKLKSENGNLKYDHQFFLRGKDEAEQKKMSKMFANDVNLNKFLEEVLSHPDVEASWMEFNVKLQYVHDVLSKSEEFKQFADEIKFAQRFPENATCLADIFDLYCKHYVTLYNEFIDKLFECFHDPTELLFKDDYKILKRDNVSNIHNGVVFKTTNTLIANVFLLDNNMDNETFALKDDNYFVIIVEAIKNIEAKLFTILKSLKINDPYALFKLSSAEKICYFFKAFLSPATKKKEGSSANDTNAFESDQLGNLQICSQVEDEFPELAEIISNYYLKKDRCSYIQVADTLFLLDEDSNTFKIPDLPMFKDYVTSYTIKILISDDIKQISLHVSAIEPLKKIAGLHASLIESHSNFIGKKMKEHIIELNS